jgi:CRP-like cAMP-binding protein
MRINGWSSSLARGTSMLLQFSDRQHAVVFSGGGEKRAASALHTPRQNRILAALPPKDYVHLLPLLDLVPLPRGWVIHGPGARQNHVYFPIAGIVSRFQVMLDGARTEFSVTGSEGVIGIASFLGGESAASAAVVLVAGHAYRLRADLLRAEMERGGLLPHLLLRYTQALMAQTGQIAACNRHHSLEQQLCRWILSSLDRSRSNELAMTQELIAEMLGVRREGVTQAAGRLRRAGLIEYARGHIAVLDRTRLEAEACECYGAVKREYERLLPGWRRA